LQAVKSQPVHAGKCAQVQQTNPYWILAWHWNPDTPDETFLQWIFWDNLGGLFFFGLFMGLLSAVCGIIGSTVVWTYQRLMMR
jgi:hypothetical protein